jgi:hypothetical protein
MLWVGSTGWEVTPAARDSRLKEEKPRPPEEKHERGPSDGRPEHVRNFLDCARSRKQPVESAEVGHFVSTAAHLGNLALRTGRAIEWDTARERPKARDFPDELVTKPYRAPWKLDV